MGRSLSQWASWGTFNLIAPIFSNKHGYHFANKSPYSQSYDFSSSHIQMWKLDHEGWAPKNWCFRIVCWRRLLRLPWTSRRPSQSILREINPEYSLEGLLLKLKLQYFGHLMQRANSIEKTLMMRKIESKRWRRWQNEMVGKHYQLNGHESEQTPEDSEGQRSLVCCSP